MDVNLAMKDFVEEHAVNNDHRTDLPDKIWNYAIAHFCASVGIGGGVVSKVEQLYSALKPKHFFVTTAHSQIKMGYSI